MRILDRKAAISFLMGIILSFVLLNLYNSYRLVHLEANTKSLCPFGIGNNYLDHTYLENRSLNISNNESTKSTNQSLDEILKSIHLHWHPLERKDRFPSVEERVKLYMSNWYYPRCTKNPPVNFTIKYMNDSFPLLNFHNTLEEGEQNEFDSIILTDTPILLDKPTILDCATRNGTNRNVKTDRIQSCEPNYSMDGLEMLKIVEEFDGPAVDSSLISTPFLVVMGDALPKSRSVPIFAKFRVGTSKMNLEKVLNPDLKCNSSSMGSEFLNIGRLRKLSEPNRVIHRNGKVLPYYQPIVWNMNGRYNFGRDVQRTMSSDIPWEAKKKMCTAWVGNMSGPKRNRFSNPPPSHLELCLSNERCSFVYNHANSSIVRAYLPTNEGWFVKGLINRTINGVSLTGPWLQLKDFLECKAVISLEGNDASTSLKWQLLSNSVVLMPRPTITSWHMEELLEPWVHYIPLRDDASDAEQMIEWVANNDEQARRIAERGTLFMYDFLYHPQADIDDALIKREIVRRYRQFWH